MKVRKNKHKILDRMAYGSWVDVTNKMWFIRKSERCKSYSPWCPDCNARLFYKQKQRFPYSYNEWAEFEQQQVELTTENRKELLKLVFNEETQ